MQQRYLVAQGQRRVLGIQDPSRVYSGEVPSEPGTTAVAPTPEAPAPAQQYVGTLTAVELEELTPWLLAVTLGSTGNVDLAAGYLAADVVKIHDDDDSHELSIVWNEAETTANRTLNWVMGGANRTITLSGSPTLGNWFDQAVKTTSAPTFDDLKLYDTNASHKLTLHWNDDETSANRTLNLIVNAGNRTFDLAENFKVLNGQDIELHASGGEKAQLAIDTQNAERTLDLTGNLTLGANFITSGGHALTLTTTATTSVTLPTAGTLIAKELFDADTFLYASSDNTPVATSPANVMAALSGHAAAAFDFNSQNLTSVGTIACGAITTSGTFNSSAGAIILTSTGPYMAFVDTTAAEDNYQIYVTGSKLRIYNATTPAFNLSVEGDGSVDIDLHDAATVGLKLGGTLVTTSAAEINELDGLAPSLNSVTLPNSGWTGIGAALERLEFYTAGYAAFMGCSVGFGTITPNATAHVYGGNLRVESGAPIVQLKDNSQVRTENTYLAYVSFIDSANAEAMWFGDGSTGNNNFIIYNNVGGFTVYTGTGGSATNKFGVDTSGNVDIVSHDAATVGLKLGGTLVTKSAAEINGMAPLASPNFTGTPLAPDHGAAATDMLVNVCYGVGDPPAANTTTEGTLYIKYVA